MKTPQSRIAVPLLAAFGAAIGVPVARQGVLCGPAQFGNVALWLGWQSDEVLAEFSEGPGSPDLSDSDKPSVGP